MLKLGYLGKNFSKTNVIFEISILEIEYRQKFVEIFGSWYSWPKIPKFGHLGSKFEKRKLVKNSRFFNSEILARFTSFRSFWGSFRLLLGSFDSFWPVLSFTKYVLLTRYINNNWIKISLTSYLRNSYKQFLQHGNLDLDFSQQCFMLCKYCECF